MLKPSAALPGLWNIKIITLSLDKARAAGGRAAQGLECCVCLGVEGWNFAPWPAPHIPRSPRSQAAPLETRVCLDLSSISRHTWLNTSPGYLLHIKQHLLHVPCLDKSSLLSSAELSMSQVRQHPPASPAFKTPFLELQGGSFNAEHTQRFFCLCPWGISLLGGTIPIHQRTPRLKSFEWRGGRGKEWQVLFTEILSPNGFGRAGLCWS